MRSDIIGMPVMVHDACSGCGGNACYIDHGPAPTYRRLTCDACGVSRGRAGKDLVEFLQKFAQQFGRPESPIILRSGKLHKPAQPGDEAAIATATKRKRKLKMKMNDLFPSKVFACCRHRGQAASGHD
jgi:hypothetical protein